MELPALADVKFWLSNSTAVFINNYPLPTIATGCGEAMDSLYGLPALAQITGKLQLFLISTMAV